MKKLLFILIALSITITSCDKKENLNNNPLLAEYNTPFNVPPFEDIKLEHFTPAFEEAMKQHKAEIEVILTNTEEATFENTVEASFYSGELLGRVNTVFGTLNSVNISPEIQTLAQEIYPKLSTHVDEITLDPRYFERVKSVYENKEKFNDCQNIV